MSQGIYYLVREILKFFVKIREFYFTVVAVERILLSSIRIVFFKRNERAN